MEIQFEVRVYQSGYSRDRYENRGEAKFTIDVTELMPGVVLQSAPIFEALLKTAIEQHLAKLANPEAEPEEAAS